MDYSSYFAKQTLYSGLVPMAALKTQEQVESKGLAMVYWHIPTSNQDRHQACE